MESKDIIRQTLNSSTHIVKDYIKDLSDEDLLARPVPGMNPIAWQLGHLLSVERKVIEEISPGSCPALPDGFDDMHNKEAAANPGANYLTKDEYVKVWDDQYAATLAVLDRLDDAALSEAPQNTFNGMCPTVGHKINFMGLHTMMHVGQFVAVRRTSGKPIVI